MSGYHEVTPVQPGTATAARLPHVPPGEVSPPTRDGDRCVRPGHIGIETHTFVSRVDAPPGSKIKQQIKITPPTPRRKRAMEDDPQQLLLFPRPPGGGFFKVPNAFVTCELLPKLPATARMIYLALLKWRKDPPDFPPNCKAVVGFVSRSVRQIAEEAVVSKASVSRGLKLLASMGLAKLDQPRKGRRESRRWYLTDPSEWHLPDATPGEADAPLVSPDETVDRFHNAETDEPRTVPPGDAGPVSSSKTTSLLQTSSTDSKQQQSGEDVQVGDPPGSLRASPDAVVVALLAGMGMEHPQVVVADLRDAGHDVSEVRVRRIIETAKKRATTNLAGWIRDRLGRPDAPKASVAPGVSGRAVTSPRDPGPYGVEGAAQREADADLARILLFPQDQLPVVFDRLCRRGLTPAQQQYVEKHRGKTPGIWPPGLRKVVVKELGSMDSAGADAAAVR